MGWSREGYTAGVAGLRRWSRAIAAAVICAGLAACGSQGGSRGYDPSRQEPPPPVAQPTTPVQSETLDNSGVMSPMMGQTNNSRQVALLVPLSGPAAAVGQTIQDSALIAVIDLSRNSIILQPYDTGGTQAGAARAAEMAIQQGAGMILGPLYADSVRAVAPIARAASVPVVAFSTDATVAGGPVHLIGFLITEQVRRILRHAVTQGRSTVSALLPNTPTGRATADALSRVATDVGMRVVAVQTYDPQGTDAEAAVANLLGRGSFDTLLLADRGIGLQAVAAQLPYQGVNPGDVMVLGTMLWNGAQDLGQEAMLVGARFPAPDERVAYDLASRFRATYGVTPADEDMAGLGFDATALAINLAMTPGSGFTVDAIRNSNGFAGTRGIFRFRADGTVERGLAIREVVRGGSRQVEPAPTTFTSFTN